MGIGGEDQIVSCMKAVILAAGEGKRMLPLTRSVPKPLLRVKNRTILDYIFDALPPEIDQVVVVVGYLKKKIQEHLGYRYQGKAIRYVVQDVLDGSATALLCCKELFLPDERFLVIYGDDMTNRTEVEECLRYPYSWVCSKAANPKISGIATIAADKRILEVIEKPEKPKGDMSAAGVMVIGSSIFKYLPTQHLNGEYYLTSLMNQFVADYTVHAVIGKERPAFVSPDEIEKLNLSTSV